MSRPNLTINTSTLRTPYQDQLDQEAQRTRNIRRRVLPFHVQVAHYNISRFMNPS